MQTSLLIRPYPRLHLHWIPTRRRSSRQPLTKRQKAGRLSPLHTGYQPSRTPTECTFACYDASWGHLIILHFTVISSKRVVLASPDLTMNCWRNEEIITSLCNCKVYRDSLSFDTPCLILNMYIRGTCTIHEDNRTSVYNEHLRYITHNRCLRKAGNPKGWSQSAKAQWSRAFLHTVSQSQTTCLARLVGRLHSYHNLIPKCPSLSIQARPWAFEVSSPSSSIGPLFNIL